MAETFKLSITGDEGTRYAGQCRVIRDKQEDIVDLEDELPLERSFVADGMDCRIEAKGRLTVEIVHDGSRSRSTTSGGVVNIHSR